MHAQQPPMISFSNVETNWSYIPKDSTFVQAASDEFSSPYWGFSYLDHKIKGDNLYILESTFSQSPNGGIEGSLLHKLNVINGEKQWINHNSSYVGNLFREGFGKSSLIVSDEENIYLAGNRSLDTLFTSLSLFGFYSKPLEISIDKITGEIKNKKESTQSSKEYYDFFDLSNRIIHTKSTGYMSLSSRIIDENEVLQNTIEFRILDESLDIVTEPYFTLKTPYPLSNGQISRQTIYDFLTEDEMIVLFSNTNPSTNIYENITLSWLDFREDADNIETQRIEITDQLAFPQNLQNETVLVFGEGEDVFIEQEFFDENEVKFNWISWYHNKQWYGRIPFGSSNEGVSYDQIAFIKSKDNKAYFIARALNEFDVLMWEKNQDDFTIIKTIIPEISTDFLRVYLRTISVLPDDKLLLSIGIDKLNDNDRRTNFSYYFSIDQNQLAIATNTEEVNFADSFVVFPNPSSGIFCIKNLKESCGNISVYNAFGDKVKSKELISNDYSFDLSDEPNGIYLIKIESCRGQIFESKVIVSK